MKFLTVGASGFVGGQLLTHVRSKGWRAVGTQSQPNDPGLAVFDLASDRITDCVESEFLDGDEPVFGIICAAITDLNKCVQEKEASHRVNVDQTIQLIDDLVRVNATPVFISSDLVFDGYSGYYNEEHARSPVMEYGRHKAEVEVYLQSNVPSALILRLSKIVGDPHSKRDVFLEWHQLLEADLPIQCIDGQVFSPTYVKDVVKGIILAAKMGLNGLYHLANTEFYSRDELATEFAVAMGKQAEIIRRPQADFGFMEERPLKTQLDSTKFVGATGMQFTSMREVITEFLREMASAEPAA